ncbi:hypothetical protein C8R44DRAFT_888849 [Mycena epipterygia]|nr:hypothetical protein C8R44DRAFT_888849 [Mycena epipterygia]
MSESQSPSAKQSQDKMPVFLACDASFRLKAKAMTANRDPATAPTQDDGENAERAWAGLKAKATTAHRDPAAAPAQDDSESAEKEMGPGQRRDVLDDHNGLAAFAITLAPTVPTMPEKSCCVLEESPEILEQRRREDEALIANDKLRAAKIVTYCTA